MREIAVVIRELYGDKIFETPPPSDTKLMRKYPYAPHPFIIEPPIEGPREYKPESLLNFNRFSWKGY